MQNHFMQNQSLNRQSAARRMSLANGGQAPILLADIHAPAPVRGYDGALLGLGRALALDGASGQALCLLVGRSITARRLRPIPWAALRYDQRLRAFLADVNAELFLQGPCWPGGVGARAQACVRRAHLYYDVHHERQAED